MRAVTFRAVAEALSVTRRHVERCAQNGDLSVIRIASSHMGGRKRPRVLLDEKFEKWAGAPPSVLFPENERATQ